MKTNLNEYWRPDARHTVNEVTPIGCPYCNDSGTWIVRQPGIAHVVYFEIPCAKCYHQRRRQVINEIRE
ncbi:MAG: hypothetical protein AAGK74_00055 [Chloroflexota bacterium]